ncbi:hypothetical protein E4T50_12369 [Aureobasidium sp. EXF-12298]|nr:hypothetical protein E4T50_12369 [Aureobasidium sp. EXF-12298]KAI4758246.1 hypothetical protein E4T51_08711 [Aureobasidium sp. EXF-12344]KAI4774383.1 hypothetical protein E4T52_10650 [Aureobasidium sp. EXF-3400]
MWPTTVLAYTLLLPATLALDISSHLSTSTTLLCSTLYSSSVLLGPLPTTTVLLQQTLDLSPVVLHNYTTTTTTVTPKPFSTLFSVLATKTVTTEAEATNGTFYITETRFGTSTVWEHATTTKTETKTRVLTTRTTRWIDAPTGFVGVRNGTVSASSASGAGAVSSAINQKQKQRKRKRSVAAAAKHPHSKRQNPSPSSHNKPKLLKPAAGKHAVEVACEQHIAIHTTEVLLLTASKPATVTLKPETIFKNRTIYGTITSTILVSGSGSNSTSTSNTPPSSFATTPAKQKKEKRDKLAFSIPSRHSRAPLASIAAMALISQPSASSAIVTNTTTVTKTPYTISFTYTRVLTTTSTATLHATTTVTSYSACFTSNLLSQTTNNKRINGVSLPLDTSDEGTILEESLDEDERPSSAYN